MSFAPSIWRPAAWAGALALVLCAAAARPAARRSALRPATSPATAPAHVPARSAQAAATQPAAGAAHVPSTQPTTNPSEGGGEGGKGKDDTREYEEFIRGANLETDSEVQSLLRRAWEHIDAQRFREAVTVLQHVIDRPSDTLASTDGRVYRSARSIATEILAALPREGRDLYRLWADGEARGIAGDPLKSVDQEALAEVVRRFSLSGLGDAAEFRLACLALDRQDYGTARRLLAAALAHPEPSIDRGQALVRLAFACARMGDSAGAAAARAQLTPLEARLPKSLLALIDQEISASSAVAVRTGSDWPMPFGSPSRQGRIAGMPAATLEASEKLWTVLWDHEWKLGTSPAVIGRAVPANDASLAARRAALASAWEERAAAPTCQPALVGDRIVYRSHDSLICLSLRTGKLQWEAKEETVNDNTGRVYYSGVIYDGNIAGDIHSALTDHLSRTVSVIDENVYQIQFNRQGMGRRQVFGAVVINGKRQEQPKVAEGNVLSAHDLKTGKLLWKFGRELDDKKPFNAVRWLAAPTPCAGRILVPVEEKGELSLAALSPSDGTATWKRFLCTYASARTVYARPVGVWAEGGEVYVASGKGVLFALDGIDGSLLWASRYEPAPPQRTGSYGVYMPEGWQEDYVAAIGDVIVVAPSDAKCLLGFERKSGKFIFSREVSDPKYCIGIAGGGLVAMTGDGLGRLDLAKQDWAWQTKVAKSCGRGVIAGESVCVPSDRHVLRIDVKSGKVLDRLRLKMPDDDPVGNLVVAGNHLVVAGVDHLTRMTSAAALFASLDKQISAAPDARAYLARGRLHRDAGREDRYIEDLRKGYELLDESDEQRGEVAGQLLAALVARARQNPENAEAMLKEAEGLASTPAQHAAAAMARAQWLDASGKTLESARAWREVASAGAHDLLADPDDPRLKVALATSGTEALRKLTSGRGGNDAALAAMAEEELKKAADAKSISSLAAVLRSFAGTPAGIRSIAPLAGRVREKAGLESAELLLADLAGDADRRVAGNALAALAELHQSRGWSKQAAVEWDRLGRDFAEIRIQTAGGATTGAALAKERLAAGVPERTWPAPARLPDPPFKCAWTIPGDATMSVVRSAADSPSQFLSEHLFVMNWREQSVQCHALATGELKWKAELRAASAASDPTARVATAMYTPHGAMQALAHDEHVAVFRSGRSVIAISLINGKRLWQLKDAFSPETTMPSAIMVYSARGETQGLGGDLAADSGTLVVRSSADTVRAVDLATGTIRWERQLKKNAANQLMIRNGHVLITSTGQVMNNAIAAGVISAAQMPAPTTIVCERHTGRVLGEFVWEGRTGYGGAVLWTDWGVIYANQNPMGGDKKIIAKEIPSGRTRWTAEWKGQVVPQVLLSAGRKDKLALIAWGYMSLASLDPATGAELWRKDNDRASYGWGQPPGISHDGKRFSILAFGQPDAQGQPSAQIWRTHSVATGELEREVKLGQQSRVYTGMIPSPFSAIGDWLVMGRMQSQTVNGRTVFSGGYTLSAFPLNGEKVAEPVDIPGPKGNARLDMIRAPLVVIGSTLLVGYRDGIAAYTGSKPRE